MPKGDNNKGRRGKRAPYDNIIIPKEELVEIIRKQRERSTEAIDRVNIRLREFYERSAEKEKARRKAKLKGVRKEPRGPNKTDFYDKF